MSEEVNVLAMSDEDFDKLPFPDDGEVVDVEEVIDYADEGHDIADETKDIVEETEEEIIEEEATDVQNEVEEEVEETLEDADKTEDIVEEETDDEETIKESDEIEVETKPKDEVIDEETIVDWSELSQPFKANGKMMNVDNVQDARQLMQFGANYTKKMKALKPGLKILKMLENNSLLDEDKLSYLIDLDKKDPEAVNKFIKESGVDPLDIDTDAEVTYKPSSYKVNDNEVLMDQVLEEIQGTDAWDTTYDVVANKWDEQSKSAIVDNPTMLREINDAVDSGVFPKIQEIVSHEQALGRLTNMSDLDAYKHVYDSLDKAGAFNQPTPAKQVIQPVEDTTKKTTLQQEAKRNSKRKAASSTKSTERTTSTKEDFNPLNMTDEDFEKKFGHMLI